MLHPVSNCTASAGYFVSPQGGGRSDAVDTPADDNAVDGKIGGTESVVTDRMEY